MGKGVIDPDVINLTVIASALIAAICWNLVTWWLGLPSSSSHTLVGGLVGAAVASAGWSSVIMAGVIKIVIFIVIAPLLGMLMSFFISAIVIYCQGNILHPELINISDDSSSYQQQPLVWDMVEMMPRNQWE